MENPPWPNLPSPIFHARRQFSGRTHFNRLVRGILLKACTWPDIWQNMWPIALFTVVLMGVAVRAFRRTLD